MLWEIASVFLFSMEKIQKKDSENIVDKIKG